MRPVAALLGAIALVASACGSDTGDPAATAVPTTPSGTAASASPLKVADLFPDLASVGLKRGAIERVPDPAGREIAFAVYEGTGISARAEIRVHATAVAAAQDFPLQAAGWKAPPVGAVFPFDLANIEGTALSGLDEARAYVATRADATGKRVWTDVYRVGRVVVVAHTLGTTESDAMRVRTEMANRIAAAAR